MKSGTLEKMKFLRLKNRLRIPKYQAVGLLESLWQLTASNAYRGDVGRFTNEEIAAWMEWDGDPDLLVNTLVDCGFIDLSAEHRLVVHDWDQHAPMYVKANVSRHSSGFLKGDSQEELPIGDSQGILPPSQAKPNLTKPSQAKTPSESSGAAQAPPAATVITLTLNDHSEYPITEDLAEEWRGLFPAVDIEQELRKMRAWLTSNPKNRKTRRGILKFVTNWLSRQQDSARPAGAKNATHRNLSAAERVRAANRERIEREGDAWN